MNTGARELARSYGLVTATALVVANMVGSGIFTTSGIMAAHLPSAGWVLFCWLLGGIIALAGARCYGELATRMPEAGGEYLYLRRLYHPALGFLTGWTSFFVGFSAPIALSGLGFAEYLFAGLSRQAVDFAPDDLVLYKRLTAAAIVIVFTSLHYLGQKFGGMVQNVLAAVKLVSILGLASAGLLMAGGGIRNQIVATGGDFSFGAAMMMVMFAYSGWNASAYIAAEVRDPRRTLPRSLTIGTVIVIALYLLVNLFIFAAAPYEELRGKVPVAEIAAVHAFGDWVPDLLSGLFAVSMLSSLGAFILIGPRVYYAMARDGLFFKRAAAVHPTFGVPGAAIVIQGCLAILMIFVGSFEQLLLYVGFALGIFPLLAVGGLFIARAERIGADTAAPIRWYPFLPILFLVASTALMVIAFLDRPFESGMALLTAAAGIPVYFLWVRLFPAEKR